MTTRPDVSYDSLGFRTRNSVLWMANVLGVVFTFAVTMYGVSSGQPLYITFLLIAWVLTVNLATYRLLRKLEPLERERPEPDDSMKLVFHYAARLPIYGYLYRTRFPGHTFVLCRLA